MHLIQLGASLKCGAINKIQLVVQGNLLQVLTAVESTVCDQNNIVAQLHFRQVCLGKCILLHILYGIGNGKGTGLIPVTREDLRLICTVNNAILGHILGSTLTGNNISASEVGVTKQDVNVGNSIGNGMGLCLCRRISNHNSGAHIICNTVNGLKVGAVFRDVDLFQVGTIHQIREVCNTCAQGHLPQGQFPTGQQVGAHRGNRVGNDQFLNIVLCIAQGLNAHNGASLDELRNFDLGTLAIDTGDDHLFVCILVVLECSVLFYTHLASQGLALIVAKSGAYSVGLAGSQIDNYLILLIGPGAVVCTCNVNIRFG